VPQPPEFRLPGVSAALWATALIGTLYLVVGVVNDLRRRRSIVVNGRMQANLANVLFRGEEEAAQAAELLARAPRTALLDMIQRVATDFAGDADGRLRNLVATAGLIRPIRRLLSSRSWRRRAQGAALAGLLPEADPLRVVLLKDSNPTVRARAAESLARADIGALAHDLVEMLDDPSAAVRFAAQQALLRGDTRAVAPLLEYLASDDRPGTRWALEIAANLPDPRLMPEIERHTHSVHAENRAVATRALGRWVPDVTALAERLDDEAPEVRATAAEAAATAGAESLCAHVGRLLRDQHWPVRKAAGTALSNLGSPGSMTLRIHLDDDDAYARDMARQMLATIDARHNRLHGNLTTERTEPTR